MYISKNSRYVLRSAQCISPSSYFLDRFKSTSKNVYVKSPKEDPNKPPLRLNIPDDVKKQEQSFISYETSGEFNKNFTEPRSKSLLARQNNRNFPSNFNNDYKNLEKSESDPYLTNYKGDIPDEKKDLIQSFQPLCNLNDNNVYNGNQNQNLSKTFDAKLSQKNICQFNSSNSFDDNDQSETDKNLTVKTSTDSAQNSNTNDNNTTGLYIIIDVPNSEQPGYASEKSETNDFNTNLTTLDTQKEHESENDEVKSRSKSLVCLSSKIEDIHSNPNVKFQVHEIDESSTYVLHLKFKKNLEEKAPAPEKELNAIENVNVEETPFKSKSVPALSTEPEKAYELEVTTIDEPLEEVKYSYDKIQERLYNEKKESRKLKSKALKNKYKTEKNYKTKKENFLPYQGYYSEIGESEPNTQKEVKSYNHPQTNESYKDGENLYEYQQQENTSISDGSIPETSFKSEDVFNKNLKAKLKKKVKEASKNYENYVQPYDATHNQVNNYYNYNKNYGSKKKKWVVSDYEKQQDNLLKQDEYQEQEENKTSQNFTGTESDVHNKLKSKSSQKKDFVNDDSEWKRNNSMAYNKVHDKSKKSSKFSDSQDSGKQKCKDYSERVEFHTTGNVVKISSEPPCYPMGYSVAHPPTINAVMVGRSRGLGMKKRDSLLTSNVDKINFKKNDFESSSTKSKKFDKFNENIIFFPRKEKFDCFSLFNSNEKNVKQVTGAKENIRKICNSNVQMCSGNLTESKSETSSCIDSLTMMKKVKEIVNFDLNNAIKIFEGRNKESKTTSVLVLKGENWEVDKEELEKCMAIQKAKMVEEILKANTQFNEGSVFEYDSINKKELPLKIDKENPIEKFLPGKNSVINTSIKNTTADSAIIFNEKNETYDVDFKELNKSAYKNIENYEFMKPDIPSINYSGKTDSIDTIINSVKKPITSVMEMRSGDSILVFDELTQSWKVDYSILEKREEQLREEEELNKRSELILETIEKIEKESISKVPRPNTREKKIFDYASEKWKTYEPQEKTSKTKPYFKESDAEEIRKKNSDMYNNLFVVNKKDAKSDNIRKDAPGLNPSKVINEPPNKNINSGITKYTANKNESSNTPPKDQQPPLKEDEKKNIERKEIETNVMEDESYWGSFLKRNILPYDKPATNKKPSLPPPASEQVKKELPKKKIPFSLPKIENPIIPQSKVPPLSTPKEKTPPVKVPEPTKPTTPTPSTTKTPHSANYKIKIPTLPVSSWIGSSKPKPTPKNKTKEQENSEKTLKISPPPPPKSTEKNENPPASSIPEAKIPSSPISPNPSSIPPEKNIPKTEDTTIKVPPLPKPLDKEKTPQVSNKSETQNPNVNPPPPSPPSPPNLPKPSSPIPEKFTKISIITDRFKPRSKTPPTTPDPPIKPPPPVIQNPKNSSDKTPPTSTTPSSPDPPIKPPPPIIQNPKNSPDKTPPTSTTPSSPDPPIKPPPPPIIQNPKNPPDKTPPTSPPSPTPKPPNPPQIGSPSVSSFPKSNSPTNKTPPSTPNTPKSLSPEKTPNSSNNPQNKIVKTSSKAFCAEPKLASVGKESTSVENNSNQSKVTELPPSVDPLQTTVNSKSCQTIKTPNQDNSPLKIFNSVNYKQVENQTNKNGKKSSDHYVSENIVEMSKNNLKEFNSKVKNNKGETIKLNITSDKRTPSKVIEINLNKTCAENLKEKKEVQQKKSKNVENKKLIKESEKIKDAHENRKFYKKFEKYKTPFSDPDYEEKSLKIYSDTESNPNLKKLNNWNKTLVLHDVTKPSESIETWLKDETDKMATLLLKVLQEAADSKPKKKQSQTRNKVTGNVSNKDNPYDNIRKKQEKNPENFLIKVRSVNIGLDSEKNYKIVESSKGTKSKLSGKNVRGIPVQSAKTAQPSEVVDAVKITTEKKTSLSASSSSLKPSQNEAQVCFNGPKSEVNMNTLAPSFITKDHTVPKIFSDLTDEIPGPEILKKISSAWKWFPIIGSQVTIFTLFRAFQLANLGSSIFSSDEFGKKKRQTLNKLFTKYGPIVNLQGPLSGNIILLHKPEHLSAVFEQDSIPCIRSVLDSLELSRQEAEEKISLGLPTDWNNPEWNHLRKFSADSMTLEYDKFFEFADLAGDSLISVIKHNKNGQNIVSEDFMEEIKRWSLEGLCRVLFTKSLRFSESKSWNSNFLMEPDKLFNAVQEASNYLSKCEKGFQPWRIMTTPSLVGLGQAYRSLSAILSKQLYQAEMSLKNKNDILKSGQASNNELTLIESMLLFDGMTSEEVTCNLIDILILGSGVASSALGFLLYHLAQNVKAQQKLLKEGKEILPEKTTKLNIQKLRSMKYMQACIKESMRLNTPYPLFFRLLQNDIFISNYIVPKGTYVVMDSRVFGMREQFFEEPDKFIPERWLNDDKWMQNAHAFSSFPLCHGPKSDLAKRIIEMQLCACVAKILRNFEIEYHFGEIVGTENFISFPDKPLKLNFIDRSD